MASSSKSAKSIKVSIDQFCAITGASSEVAKRMLEACNGSLEMAINMHVDAEESLETPNHEAATSVQERMENEINNEEIRAPIPPTRGVLVEEPFSFGVHARRKPARSIFDGFRDFEAETRRQEEELWNPSHAQNRKKKQTLEDLFRPPLDLMHKGTFDTARQQGQVTNKWLMVNVQNVQEFSCQMLNRDVWSNHAVKSIIQEHFVFYQVYHDSDEGQRYMQFYKVEEWPYVAIIDPRTGENLVVWHRIDPVSFSDLVTGFLSDHPSLDGTSPPSPPKKRQKINSIVDASEDSQMEAAIQASLMDSVKNKDDSDDESEEIETFDSDTEVSNSSSKVNSNHHEIASTSSLDNQNNKSEEKEQDANKESSENGEHNNNDLSEWEKYLGDPNDAKSNVLLRFPDGKKQQLSLPASSKLKALVLYVDLKGFRSDNFELVTNFPRRKLSLLDSLITLKDAGIYPQETIFVQAR